MTGSSKANLGRKDKRLQRDEQQEPREQNADWGDVLIVPEGVTINPADFEGNTPTIWLVRLFGGVIDSTPIEHIRVYTGKDGAPKEVRGVASLNTPGNQVADEPKDEFSIADALESVIRIEMWWLVLGLASRMSRLNDMKEAIGALNDVDVALESLANFNQRLEASVLWFQERAVGISHFERLRQAILGSNRRAGASWEAIKRLDALDTALQWLDHERKTNDDAGVEERCESEAIILMGLSRMVEMSGTSPHISAVQKELDWLEEQKKESKDALARENPTAGSLVEHYGNVALEHVAEIWGRWVGKIESWSSEFETSMQGEQSTHYQESPLERVQSRIQSVEDPAVAQRLEQVYAAFEPYAHSKELPTGTTPQIMNFLLVSASVPGLWERLDSKDHRFGDALLGCYADGLGMTKLAARLPGVKDKGMAGYLVRQGIKKLFEWMPGPSRDLAFDKYRDFPLDELLSARHDRMRVSGENRARENHTSAWGKMAASRRWWTSENDGTGESLTPED